MSANLCGDPTCTSYACTQAAMDAWNARQWDEAGEIVRAALREAPEGAEIRDLGGLV